MTEMSAKGKIMEWVCRGLFTANLLAAVAGYLIYFQTTYVLASPLIPKETIYEIAIPYMKASLIAGAFLVAGTWSYFFKKKVIAIVMFSIPLALFEVLILFFRNSS